MASYLPAHGGLLPYFLLYTSISAIIHTIVCYAKPISALRQFSGPQSPPHTPLLAHVYGVKNTYTALIRLVAAYGIDDSRLYLLAASTFVGVLFLYGGEFFVWKTVGRREVAFPLVTSSVGLVWMWAQSGWYLG